MTLKFGLRSVPLAIGILLASSIQATEPAEAACDILENRDQLRPADESQASCPRNGQDEPESTVDGAEDLSESAESKKAKPLYSQVTVDGKKYIEIGNQRYEPGYLGFLIYFALFGIVLQGTCFCA